MRASNRRGPMTKLMQEVLAAIRSNNLVFMSGEEIGKVLCRNPQSLAGPLAGLVKRDLIVPKRMPCAPFRIFWNPNDHYNGGRTMLRKRHYAAVEKREFFPAFQKLRWSCAKLFWRKNR